MKVSVGQANCVKRISGNFFVPHYDSFPMNPEKKTLIPYTCIYNAFNKDSF